MGGGRNQTLGMERLCEQLTKNGMEFLDWNATLFRLAVRFGLFVYFFACGEHMYVCLCVCSCETVVNITRGEVEFRKFISIDMSSEFRVIFAVALMRVFSASPCRRI